MHMYRGVGCHGDVRLGVHMGKYRGDCVCRGLCKQCVHVSVHTM